MMARSACRSLSKAVVPPIRRSSSQLPRMMSRPNPPISTSRPAPPQRVSLPAPPSIRLLAALPWSTSAKAVPIRFSKTQLNATSDELVLTTVAGKIYDNSTLRLAEIQRVCARSVEDIDGDVLGSQNICVIARTAAESEDAPGQRTTGFQGVVACPGLDDQGINLAPGEIQIIQGCTAVHDINDIILIPENEPHGIFLTVATREVNPARKVDARLA